MADLQGLVSDSDFKGVDPNTQREAPRERHRRDAHVE